MTTRAELHCHSNRRQRLFYCPLLYDSVQTEEEILEECSKKNIKVLAITDHDTLEGYRNAKKIIEKKGLDIILIPGCEISTKDGHVLAHGINEEIPEGLSAKETVDLIHKQGGLATADHPYMTLGLGDKIFDIDFDAIEAFNSGVPQWANKKCQKRAMILEKPMTAGSDCHQPEYIGYASLLFENDIKNFEDFKKNILEKKFTVRFKPTPLLTMTLKHVYKNIIVQIKELLNYLNKRNRSAGNS